MPESDRSPRALRQDSVSIPVFRAGSAKASVSTGRLSIVIPCLNEATRLPRLLADLAPLRKRGHEIIVVDGGSDDGTLTEAAPGADRVLSSVPGRARQMNAGVAVAQGDAFWFLHADSRVPANVPAAVLDALRAGHAWGRCRVRLSGESRLLRITAFLMNLRSCVTGIATGDQGIFVTCSVFRAAGGFPEIALMEDIALSRSLKRQVGRPACVRASLMTSARRWEQRGVWRTVLLMWRLRFEYWLGADPERLARRYQ